MTEKPSGPAATGMFVPPEGWTKSPNVCTSRFASEMHNTTNWYRNDGLGNGYFAPGWDNARIARRTGVLRWIGLALAVLFLGLGAVMINSQYAEQSNYEQIKSASNGVETTAVVGTVRVEHSITDSRDSPPKYHTRTTASIRYSINGHTAHGDIESSRGRSRAWGEEPVRYPEPAWSQGEKVMVYADPEKPERFVLFHEYKEADAGSIPRAAVLTLCFTAGLMILPVLFFIAGARNMRKAWEL